MQIIKGLEKEERRIYTGSIGFITPQKEMVFNVAIRTILLQKGRGEMGIGSGVVYDSDPQKEYEECLLKARFLTCG
jgi:para-aminobenzoate synthetase/4-amino-4-deoxychorismate lyase